MLSLKERYSNTIAEIQYSDEYDKNNELFDSGVNILHQRINNEDYSEFSDDERTLLEEIFTIMECGK